MLVGLAPRLPDPVARRRENLDHFEYRVRVAGLVMTLAFLLMTEPGRFMRQLPAGPPLL